MNLTETLKTIYADWKCTSPYDIDGLVISSNDVLNVDEFYPSNKYAWKHNSNGVKTTVKGIEWNISKGGLLKPVVLLEPVEIDGTTVKRATGYNAAYIQDNRIKIGIEVSVIKSGSIIPKIINIIEEMKTHINNGIPMYCPCCNSLLIWKGVDIACNNSKCGEQSILKVNSFLRQCGVENVSEVSLKNWNINTFEDVLKFKPDFKYKSQVSFVSELNNKVFNKTANELFSNMTFDGAGSRTIIKLIEHYGSIADTEEAMYRMATTDFPEGIGQKTIDKIKEDWFHNRKILTMIMSDNRYKAVVEAKTPIVQTNISGKSFCITGTLTKKRSEIEKMIVDNGGKISSVSKNLDYLIVGTDAGSKLDKAKNLNINIISENEFLKMV